MKALVTEFLTNILGRQHFTFVVTCLPLVFGEIKHVICDLTGQEGLWEGLLEDFALFLFCQFALYPFTVMTLRHMLNPLSPSNEFPPLEWS